MYRIIVTVMISLSLLANLLPELARRPLTRPKIKVQLQPTSERLIGVDPQTGEPIYQPDPEAKVRIDHRTGHVVYTWKGFDGKIKTIVFEPPIKLEVIVKGVVRFDAAEKRYRYIYELTNLPTSEQKLVDFIVLTEADLEGVTKPDEHWWSKPLQPTRIPLFQSKKGWWWADVKYGREGIKPGQSEKGFSFESEGLPGIVNCYAQGYVPPLRGVGEEPPAEIMESIEKLPRYLYGRTVGPVDIHSVSLETLLGNLLTMIDESLRWGWIADTETVDFFKSELKETARLLKMGDKSAAERVLSEVINDAERLREKKLTSEAYAILKFNAEHIKRALE